MVISPKTVVGAEVKVTCLQQLVVKAFLPVLSISEYEMPSPVDSTTVQYAI